MEHLRPSEKSHRMALNIVREKVKIGNKRG
jgi:hypothetical protein